MGKRAAGEEVETSNAGKRGGDKRRVGGGQRREREEKAEAA